MCPSTYSTCFLRLLSTCSEAQRRVLLDPQYASALVGLLAGATTALSGNRQLSEEQAEGLDAIVAALSELAEMSAAALEPGGLGGSWKSGGRNASRGRGNGCGSWAGAVGQGRVQQVSEAVTGVQSKHEVVESRAPAQHSSSNLPWSPPAIDPPLRSLLQRLPDAHTQPPHPLPPHTPALSVPTAEGGSKARRGRDLHGKQVVPALVGFLLVGDPAGGLLPLKRSASTTLLDFLLNSKANCAALTALPDRWAGWLASAVPGGRGRQVGSTAGTTSVRSADCSVSVSGQ